MDAPNGRNPPPGFPVWEPFLIALGVLAILGAISVLGRHGMGVPGARPVDLLSSLTDTSVLDTHRVAALEDTVEAIDTAAKPDTSVAAKVPDLATLDTLGAVAIEDSAGALGPFFDRLKAGQPGRVAWFGDSFTEGDILVGDLREMLQKSFGGGGIGIVPATTPVARYRATIRQEFSNDWKERNLTGHGGPALPLGIAGRVSQPRISSDSAKASWVTLEGGDRQGTKVFDRLRVLVSQGGDSLDSVVVRTEDRSATRPLGAGPGLREILVDLGGTNSVDIRFRVRDTVAVQALSVEESKPGVLIDNLSFRGNSGVGLLHIPSSSLAGTNRFLGYGLVVLQFGANVADTTMTGYGWYRDRMVEVVGHVRSNFPGAGILVLGVGDRGVKGADGRIVTHPSIPLIVKAQRDAARRTGCAFWDMREAMGGENAMARWSAAGMVSADYVHISPQGGRKLAKALHKSILQAWSKRVSP